MPEQDREFIEYIVKQIVDQPEAVRVERTIDELGVLLTLSVDPTDMGKVIGKDGNTARAIRTLLRVLGAKENARLNLKILEPEGRVPESRPAVTPKRATKPTTKTTPVAEEPETTPIEEEKATELV